MHQTLNQSAYRAKTIFNTYPPVAHHLSWILRIYWIIVKHPQNGSKKGISTLKLAAGPQGKLMKIEFRHLGTVPVPVHCKEKFYNSAAEPDKEMLKLPIQGYVQAK